MLTLRSDQRLQALADSYLDHVLIALRANDRGVNFRNFLDPWWCYSRGGAFVVHRRDGGFGAREFNNPCAWGHRERLPLFDWCSDEARKIIELGVQAKILDRKSHPVEYRLIIEHSVPLSLLAQQLWANALQWDRESLRSFLKANMMRAVLSHSEDLKLRSAKLTASMPNGWQWGNDPFARYAHSGIIGKRGGE